MPRGAEPGERRGGRAAGTPNKRTQEQVAAIKTSGITPLEYMIGVMRDESVEPSVRLDAASKAAPYVHPRLSATDVSLRDPANKSVQEMSDAELMAIIAGGSDSNAGEHNGEA